MAGRRQVTRTPREVSTEPSKAPKMLRAASVAEMAPNGTQGRTKTVDLGLFDRRKPVVIGIDQSLVAFGLVAFSPQDETAFCWLYEPKDFGVRRLMNIRFFVRNTIAQIVLRSGTPEHVVMEAYAYSRQMGHTLGECGATVKLALIEALGSANKVAYPSIVIPQHMKKFATGRGDTKKNRMLLEVHRKWKVTFDDDNLADAYALARVAAALATGVTEFEYERDVIRRIVQHTEWELCPLTPKSPRRSTSSERAKSPSSG